MDKKQLHHIRRLLRPIKPHYFLVLALVFGIVSVYSLRQNNVNMITLRTAVFKADEDNGNTEAALRNLREYVYSHMNTNLAGGDNTIYPPIQLKHSYDRAIAAAQSTSPDNAQIYNDAQTECEKQFPRGLSGSGRIPCIQQYVATHGIQEEATIPVSLYEFDFVSPRWSPDLAGWSMVAAGLSGALAAFSFVSDRWLKRELRD